MDLGIGGRRALVSASSQGLGLACALALAEEGCAVTINGRNGAQLGDAQRLIEKATGHRPQAVSADIGTIEGRQAVFEACPDPDILVTNNGGPQPGKFPEWNEIQWLAAIEANMLAPIMMIHAALPAMRANGFGRIVNITSAMVKSPSLPMGLSTAARSGLTAISKALSRDVAKDNVTINNLLPERIETARLSEMTEHQARARGIGLDEARLEMLRPVPAGRFGRPEELGAACAFLCSAQAGFITGQNISVDGGGYRGLI
jgi:3-oxoacyl-[acyl-carrier protein] reductase